MTDTSQKLREALSELMSIVSIHQKATGNNFAWAEMDFAREALALPTADHIPDAGEMVVDHLPDAGKMIETAAPVGERDDHVPEIAARLRLVAKLAGCPNAVPEKDTTAVGAIFSVLGHIRMALESKSSAQVEVNELPKLPEADGYKFEAKGISKIDVSPHGGAWFPLYSQKKLEAYARAALSAGDAVDAQRYRWLREQHWSNSAICCVYKPKQNVRLGGTCPSGDLLDSAIDAAMRKGQL